MILFRVKYLNAGHVPVVLAIIFVFNLGLTYCVSVYRGDVDPIFPYISSSGDSRPESCVFSALLNICSFFSLIVIYLRYNLVGELNQTFDNLLRIVNNICFYIGLIGVLGMFIVANFQETAVIQIHLFGAIMCFGSGCAYMLVQTWMSYRMHPVFASVRIAHIRLTLTCIGTLCFFIVAPLYDSNVLKLIGELFSFNLALCFGLLASYTFHQHFPDLPTPRPWNKKLTPTPGYDYHCVSAVAEWTSAIMFITFLLSYSRDFEKIQVDLYVQPLVQHLDHSVIIEGNDDHLS